MNNIPTPPPDEHEELVHPDDSIIGKAARWSLVVAVAMVVVVFGVILLFKRKTGPLPQQITQISAPKIPDKPKAEIPVAGFTDITKEAGITFVHHNGAYGDKLLPEPMGGGVAFFDFDNDGAPDLLFINSTDWPGHLPAAGKSATHALYHNDGQGRFSDVTAGSGLDASFYGMGVAIGDYDNDGLDDVFITAVGGNHLFHNDGKGKFGEVTAGAGVGGSTDDWSTCAAWLDYDNDGRLDLFVGNYVRWSKEIDAEVGYKIDGRTRAYGQPNNFAGTFPRLYHNAGNGHFTDVSRTSGVQVKNPSTGVPAAKTLGVAPVDLDGDGWIDLVVANDTVPNFVFINQRNGTFREIGAISGLAFDSYGNTRGAMGIDAARYRNDDKLGIVIGNFANEMTALYVAQHSPTNFADEAIPDGIGPASRLLLKFGVFFFDYDLDGWLDLLSANGHLEEEIHKIQASQQYRQPVQLFWNAGGAGQNGFLVVPPEKCGHDIFQPIVGRGSAFADIDGDGDLDLVLTQVNGPPLLLRNDQQLHHHWVRLKLIGAKSNRDAIGAWVQTRVGDRLLSRQVMPARSYLSQSELPVVVGLGSAPRPDDVTIIWPDGSRQKVEPVRVDGLTVVEQAH